MGYNRANFTRIRDEYEQKYIKAREIADKRRIQIHSEIPEILEIDKKLERTGAQIMSIICSQKEDAEEKIAELRKDNLKIVEKRKELLLSHGYNADYTDIKYECEKCADSGYVGTAMCECMRKKLIYAGYESSGMTKLMKSQRFDNFSLDYYKSNSESYENMKIILDAMKRFADEFKVGNGKNIALFGGTGLGKTHLSSAVAGELIEKGFDVLYASCISMISDFENRRFGNGYSNETVNIEKYTDCELLIIDDLGTEVVNQFTVSCVYNVINTRLNKGLSTIISCNYTPSEFRDKYWDRITSRVFGEYMVFQCSGQDVRRQKLMK